MPTEPTNRDADPEWITLEQVQRLHLQDGDTLVLTLPQKLSAEQLDRIAQSLRGKFPDHTCVVLDNGVTLTTVTVEKKPAAGDIEQLKAAILDRLNEMQSELMDRLSDLLEHQRGA